MFDRLNPHGKSIVPRILSSRSCPRLMFLTWIIDLQHHVGLEAETLEAAQLDRLDHGDVQQPVPGVQRANVVHSRLNKRILTKSWIHLHGITNKEVKRKYLEISTLYAYLFS